MTRRRSKVAGFFHRVGDAVLGAGRLPGKLRRGIRERRKGLPKRRAEVSTKLKREVPHKLRGFFEHRHAGWPEYVMLKVQILILALFGSAVVLVFFSVGILPLILLLSLLSLCLVYLTATQLRVAFERDFPAYRSFVAMILILVWALVGIRYLLVEPLLEISPASVYRLMILVISIVGLVLGSFAVFKLKYGRDYTYGIVEEVRGGKAAVRIGYDICSNAKSGLYFLDSLIRVKRGDRVKVWVERSAFGLRGSRPKAILGKVRLQRGPSARASKDRRTGPR